MTRAGISNDQLQALLDNNTPLTPLQINDLVLDGKSLSLEIKSLEKRHSLITKLLVLEASRHPDDHQPVASGGGTAWFATAFRCQARVTFPDDSLKDQILSSSSAWVDILKKLGDVLPGDLFTNIDAWVPKPNFKTLAVKFLGDKKAQSLIRLCSKDSTPKCHFEETHPQPK
jgi:hypothetical protein